MSIERKEQTRAMIDCFSGVFGDFETFFRDTDLRNYNIYFWPGDPKNSLPNIVRVIGFTNLGEAKIMLHVVGVEADEILNTTEELVTKRGVSLIPLDKLLEHGATLESLEDESEDAI